MTVDSLNGIQDYSFTAPKEVGQKYVVGDIIGK